VTELPIRKAISARAGAGLALLLLALSAAPAWAHIGPPYPIMQNRKIGPLKIEVWSNPDVGTGSFFVVIDPPAGSSVPPDMKVQVAVQPVSQRLPEATYGAWREKLKDHVEFKTVVPFDKEETWHVRVILSSAAVSGETDTDVMVTPTLLGRWDLLLFLLPFLGISVLWFKAMSMKRKRRKRASRKTPPVVPVPAGDAQNEQQGVAR
jgi:hypothetical protein